jgi:dTDP-4-amino-4,6-dideoxygalactose transaminase
MPTHSEFIPFHRPAIGEDEIQSVIETLKSGWLTTGPKVKRFEEDFARYLGCSHAIAVNSGTAALHLALDAIGIKEGDDVILPTMTFAATAEVVLYFKANPVLVDCQRDTLNLDPTQIEAAISSKTKAIIPVHFGGQPCEMDRILDIAKRHNLRVIEDAAHALPARDHGRTIGTIGDITCFSFYATKTITTGEGGMATTENSEWAERMRMMSLHGISHDAWKRYTKEGSWYYEILYPGFKYNLTDIAAAIGIEQLKKCDEFWEARQRIAMNYTKAFADLEEIQLPTCRNDVQHAWHLFVIQLNLERLRINRNQFVEALREKEIGTSVHFIPLHLHPYYRDKFGYKTEDFLNAGAAFERIISLPIYPRMTEGNVRDVIVAVRKLVQEYRR